MGATVPVTDLRVRRARLALWFLAVVSGVWLVARNWDLWFGGDDWLILLDRRVSPGPGQLGLFQPHNEHWSTVPILVFKGLEAVFGVASYWPYVVVLVAVHVAIVVLLWHVMVRAEIDPWLALGFVALMAIPGVGFENLTNVWQVQLISPLALGLGALLVVPERGTLGWRDGVASLLLTVGMACSGLGITMLGVVALVALVRRGPRVALAIAALPADRVRVVVRRVRQQGTDVTSLSYSTVPRFVWDGLTDALGDVVRLRELGVVIVLASLAWLVWQLTRRPIPPRLVVPGRVGGGRGRVARPHRLAARHDHGAGVVALRVHHHRVDVALAGRRGRLARASLRPRPVLDRRARGHRGAPRGSCGRAGAHVRSLRRQHRGVEAGREGRVPEHGRAGAGKGTSSSTIIRSSSSSRR